ncbi:MAG: alpha/beta hydrolase [Bdellovibrionota bacterium]
MSSIPDWMSQRLKKISQHEFASHVSHRTLKSKKNEQIIQEYYSVPLALGCGTAILTAPKNENKDDNYGTLVIMLHGLGQDSTSPFWHWIYEFAANGIAVLSVDWDGHGAGSSSLLDIQEATRSVPLIIQRLYGEENGYGLNKKRSGPRCFLMGHSFGASLALIAATREDVFRHVFGVIAVSPVLSVQSFLSTSREVFSFLSPTAWISDFANKLGFYGLWGLFASYGSFKRKQYPLRMKLDIDYVEQAREFVRETFENRRILKKVRPPVLWFHGMKDSVCPYYHACQLMLEIPSAFFAFCDDSRGHIRTIFSDEVLSSTMKFIKNNSEYYERVS